MLLYNIIIFLYGLAINLSSIWSYKARQWKQDRIGNLASLEKWKAANKESVIWLHCASYGEYEQGLPLIELIRDRHPNVSIALTFFSPSGYNAVQKSAPVQWVGYIPLDKSAAVFSFLDALDPDKVIFIKNEWWWNILKSIIERKVPLHFVSMTARESHYFIKYPIRALHNIIKSVTSFGVIDDHSATVLSKICPKDKIYIGGDMRVDRVLSLKNNSAEVPLSKKIQNIKCIIYGSIWKSDLTSIRTLINSYPSYAHIIFPHELDLENFKQIRSLLIAKDVKNIELVNPGDVVVVNKMGILSRMYRYGSAAYIGGGFGDGIHNVLEPAVYGIPLFTGPNILKSTEAIELEKRGIIHLIDKRQSSFPNLSDHKFLDKVKNEADSYFKTHEGATEITYNYIFGESPS